MKKDLPFYLLPIPRTRYGGDFTDLKTLYQNAYQNAGNYARKKLKVSFGALSEDMKRALVLQFITQEKIKNEHEAHRIGNQVKRIKGTGKLIR